MSSASRAEAFMCCCCLRKSQLYSLILPNSRHGDAEVYSEMILQCYGFQIIAENDDFGNNTYLICESCVTRLREALLLRIQLEIARDFFRENLIKCNSENKDVPKSNDFISIIDDIEESSDDNYFTDADIEEVCGPSESKISKSELKFKEDKVVKNSLPNKDSRKKTKLSKKSPKISSKQNSTRLKSKVEMNATGNKKGKSSEQSMDDGKSKILENIEHNDHTYAITKFDKPFKLNKNDITCKVCDETFPYHMALVRHMSTHFTKYVCHICGFRCATRHSVRSHILIHENRNMQKCEICKKTVKGNINLRKHVQRHISNLVFSCPQCSERFTSYIARVKHLHVVHGVQPRMHKCTLCPKQFTSSSHLSEHTKKYHLLERNHKCQECPSCFYSAFELKEHMTMHTGVKNFHCTVCGKTFARRRTLQVHMKIHNNVKDYVCPVCSRPFRQRGTLKSHMKIHEKVQIEIISNDICMLPELSI